MFMRPEDVRDGILYRNGEAFAYDLDTLPIRRVSQSSVFYRDRWTCWYCATPWSELEPEEAPFLRVETARLLLDHIVPESLGGPWEVGNLVASCRRCNSRKSDLRLRHEDAVLADVAARSHACDLDPAYRVSRSRTNEARAYRRYDAVIDRALAAVDEVEGDDPDQMHRVFVAVIADGRPWVRR
jgi:5-methylcytosine-specific restriction endonuclease McrA